MFPREPAPEKIGAYRVIRRLAGSGATSVYLARVDGPMGFQRAAELKLVPSPAEGDPRIAEELAREASICAELNHPAIVRMFDFFEHERSLVLVLEHVEGTNLDRLSRFLVDRRQKLGDAAVYFLVHRVSGALAHAHAATDDRGQSAPVIHRNLHPESIVIGWDGQVRLTGFGIGKILGRTPDTVVGIVKGTPGYMAPEQARGERVTTKADVYGLGLLLWSLLSGRRPPTDGTRPEAIATLRPDLPRAIVVLIDRALTPVPEERAISAEEIERTLEKVVHAETGKAELVLRVQSAHASIEVEDAEGLEEGNRRPTIPVKAGKTTRPGGSSTVRVKDPAAGDAGDEPVAVDGGEGAPPISSAEGTATIPVPPNPSQLLAAMRRTMSPVRGLFKQLVAEAKKAESASAGPAVRAGSPAGDPPPAGKAPGVVAFGAPPAVPPAAGTPIAGTPVAFGPPPPLRAVAPSNPGVVAFGPPPVAPPVAPPASGGIPISVRTPSGGGPDSRAGGGRFRSMLPGSRRVSTATTMVVSALTAAVVALAWTYFARRDERDPPSPAPAATSVSSVAAPPIVSAAVTAVTAAPVVDPAKAAGAPRPSKDVASLPAGAGYLTVKFPASADVYVNGRRAGAVNEPLQVRCGRWFIRLAHPLEGRYPEWVTAGTTVAVECQGETTVEMKPAPGRAPR